MSPEISDRLFYAYQRPIANPTRDAKTVSALNEMNKDTTSNPEPGNPPAIVVMAKRPVPGRVKTRLTPSLSPHQAARAHAAMLDCVLARLASHLPGRHYLALDGHTAPTDPPDAPALAYDLPPAFRVIDQGTGDLGDRITHVWKSINQGPAVFFGVDSPDIPTETLGSLWGHLASADALIGPVSDGGYYCLAARQLPPPLLTNIDWGTPAVYHQTHQAAQDAGLDLRDLAPWHDVDEPADLLALQERLQHTRDPALLRLNQRLSRITQDTTR